MDILQNLTVTDIYSVVTVFSPKGKEEKKKILGPVAVDAAVWPPESLPGQRARREREEDDRSLREGGGRKGRGGEGRGGEEFWEVWEFWEYAQNSHYSQSSQNLPTLCSLTLLRRLDFAPARLTPQAAPALALIAKFLSPL